MKGIIILVKKIKNKLCTKLLQIAVNLKIIPEEAILGIFPFLVRKYNVKLYHKDSFNNWSMVMFENLEHFFKTKHFYDAQPLMNALNDKIKNSNICIDVGASIGIVSIWMAKNSKKVYSFEPELNNRKRFMENASLNKISNIQLMPFAVSDKDGFCDLNISRCYGHHSLAKVKASIRIGTQKVETKTLDSFCLQNRIEHIDFLKIDVEGFELEVFKGAKKLLQQRKIKLLVFEVSKIPLKNLNRKASQLSDFLDRFGYEVLTLNEDKISRKSMDDIYFEDLIARPRYRL
ncbi:MAG: FkbM family methyltransferase [Candidatus Omnitrophota bacterium]